MLDNNTRRKLIVTLQELTGSQEDNLKNLLKIYSDKYLLDSEEIALISHIFASSQNERKAAFLLISKLKESHPYCKQ